MTGETLTRQIKIYCPQHQTTFEIAESPKIVCEIREHALSNDFPKGEFWEYCCDCQTFFPSDLEVGGKAKIACPQCERTTLRRFICDECKIVAYDSGEDTKGKIFHLNSENFAVAPACPGCLKVFSEVKSHLHKCEETQIVLSTPREICPFCKKETVKAKPKPQIETPRLIKCPKCRTNNEADSFFCNDCGEALRSNPQLAKRGTSTAKTQLLGSICPNCGIGNPPDGDFCVNCGQALKSVPAQPRKKQVALPPPQVSIPTQIIKPGVVGYIQPEATAMSKGATSGLTAGGVILILVIACCVCVNVQSNKNSSGVSTTPTSTPSYSSTPYASYTATPYPKPTNTATTNKASSKPSLPNSFNKDFLGTIGRQSLSMNLRRDGSDLKGTASTGRTDYLYGTIDSDGNFTAKGYENDGSYESGIYRGRIYSDGSMSGTWTNPQGGQSISFSLSED